MKQKEGIHQKWSRKMEEQETRNDTEQRTIKSTHHSLNTSKTTVKESGNRRRLHSCQDPPKTLACLNDHNGQGQEEADEYVPWPMTW